MISVKSKAFAPVAIVAGVVLFFPVLVPVAMLAGVCYFLFWLFQPVRV